MHLIRNCLWMLGFALLCASCGKTAAYDVDVSLVTDYLPKVQFNKVRLDVYSDGNEEEVLLTSDHIVGPEESYRGGAYLGQVTGLKHGGYIFKITLFGGTTQEPTTVAEGSAYVVLAHDITRTNEDSTEGTLELRLLRAPDVPPAPLAASPNDQVRAISFGSAGQLFRLAVLYYVSAFEADSAMRCPNISHVDGVTIVRGTPSGDHCKDTSGRLFYGRVDVNDATPVVEPFTTPVDGHSVLSATSYARATSTIKFKDFEAVIPGATCGGVADEDEDLYLNGTVRFNGTAADLTFYIEDLEFEYKTKYENECSTLVKTGGRVLSYEGHVTNWAGWNPPVGSPETTWSGEGDIAIDGFGAAHFTTTGETKIACSGAPAEGAAGTTVVDFAPDKIKFEYDGCGQASEPPLAKWYLNDTLQTPRISGVTL